MAELRITAYLRLSPDEDQEQLRTVVRAFLDKHCTPSDVRRLMETAEGYDTSVWQQCAQQLGLTGLDVPEQYGGAGASLRELAITCEELGRSLACLPYFSSVVLATGALLLGDDESARGEHLPGIAAGTTLATLAVSEESGSWSDDHIATTAHQVDGTWTLEGGKCFVLDGLVADLLLVAAQTPVGLSLFAVAGDAPGLVRTAMRTLDPTRKQAKLQLRSVPAQLVGTSGGASSLLDKVRNRAVVALACEQLGVAERALDMSVSYAKDRVQFGRRIGSFQAIKHRCADMAQHVEASRSAVAWAVACATEDDSELALAAAMVGVCCSEAAVFTATENVQVHGGIGFTWEHPAHLYFRRARSNALLLGSPSEYREQLLTILGL